MVHTVALIGHTGNVGANALNSLVKKQEQGLIKLVILHRPSSDISKVPAGVETRVVELENPVIEKVVEALKGVNVLLSTLNGAAAQQQVSLVQAFAKTGDAVAFVPSAFSAPWTEYELSKKGFQIVGSAIGAPIAEAAKLNIGITKITVGLFADYFPNVPPFGLDKTNNTLTVYKSELDHKTYIISTPYLGAVLAEIVTRDPKSIAGEAFYAYEYTPTLQQAVDILSEVKGSPTKIINFTEEQYHSGLDQPPVGCIGDGFIGKNGRDEWNWVGEEIKVPGWQTKGFEATFREYVSA